MDLFEALRTVFLDYGYAAVFGVLVLCGIGLPLPEDVPLVGAGVVVYEGHATYPGMVAIGILGILVGDSILFWLGRRYGPALLRKKLFAKMLHAERMAKVQGQFDEHALKVVFFARFIAGIRACVYFSAGTLGMKYRTFVLLDFLGALVSAPVWIWLGWRFGGHIESAFSAMAQADRVILALIIGFSLYFGWRWWRNRRRAAAGTST